ncbi:MAG: toll/interleukin-1 receptor domain-containing protein [Clostridia bacterium]|nr:toll/interleukin-1 receptor domain-containing protein [Clostridia bacterium]
MENELIFHYDYITQNGEHKEFRILSGSISTLDENYDIAVCSAFKDNYYPLRGTLIGALYRDLYLSVQSLSQNKAIFLEQSHCWLSEPTDTALRRIACVEITELDDAWYDEAVNDALLKRSFSSLRMLLEQAEWQGIAVGRIVLPILGTGAQLLSVSEVAGPLLKQLFYALETIDGISSITVCEYDRDKAEELATLVKEMLKPTPKNAPDVFISYSSKQLEEAKKMREALATAGVSCWMAPDSIPSGSQYWQEIPIALANTKVLVLLLTPDAESSKWVPKELNTAIENRNIVIPFQPYDYPNGAAFRFILSDIQIIRAWQFDEKSRMDRLIVEVLKALKQ